MGFTLFTLFFLLLGRSCALNSDGTLLLSFRYSILSDPLSVLDNWDYTDDDPCSWTGVTCAQVGPSTGTPDIVRVISLILPNSQLLGSIPLDLGLLEHLRTLDLSNNFFSGSLPVSLFNSSELQVLSLSNNMLSGELPELAGGGLSSLQLLNLSDNAFAGLIPESFTSLQNLTVVSLKSNRFSSKIPGGFDFVQVLDLSSNMLNGSLPVDFGGDRLAYLNLSYNQLSGSLPAEFAEKIPANASIDLAYNNLNGEIPQSVALINQKTESFAGNVGMCGKPLQKLCTVPSTAISVPPNVTSTVATPGAGVTPRTDDSTPASNSPNGVKNKKQSMAKPATIAGVATGIAILAVIVLYALLLKKKKGMGESKSFTTMNKDQETATIKELNAVSCGGILVNEFGSGRDGGGGGCFGQCRGLKDEREQLADEGLTGGFGGEWISRSPDAVLDFGSRAETTSPTISIEEELLEFVSGMSKGVSVPRWKQKIAIKMILPKK